MFIEGIFRARVCVSHPIHTQMGTRKKIFFWIFSDFPSIVDGFCLLDFLGESGVKVPGPLEREYLRDLVEFELREVAGPEQRLRSE